MRVRFVNPLLRQAKDCVSRLQRPWNMSPANNVTCNYHAFNNESADEADGKITTILQISGARPSNEADYLTCRNPVLSYPSE